MYSNTYSTLTGIADLDIYSICNMLIYTHKCLGWGSYWHWFVTVMALLIIAATIYNYSLTSVIVQCVYHTCYMSYNSPFLTCHCDIQSAVIFRSSLRHDMSHYEAKIYCRALALDCMCLSWVNINNECTCTQTCLTLQVDTCPILHEPVLMRQDNSHAPNNIQEHWCHSRVS